MGEGVEGQETSAGFGWTRSLVPLKAGEGATTPIFPLLAAGIGASDLAVGVMEMLFSVLMMAGAFVWGRASDEAQRRKLFILLGFVGTALTLTGLALADSVWTLLVLRGLQGFAIAAYVTVGGALVADRSSPHRVGRWMGHMNMLGGLGYTVGLLAGAYLLLTLDLHQVFGVAAVLSVASVLLGLGWIDEPDWRLRLHEARGAFGTALEPLQRFGRSRETPPARHHDEPVSTDPHVHKRAWAYLGATLLAFLATSATFALLPLHLSRAGLGDSLILVLFVAFSATTTLTFRPAGVLAERWSYRRVQVGSMIVRALAFAALALPLADRVAWLAGFFVLAGITWAAMTTTGLAAMYKDMRIRRRGELAAIYTVAGGMGMSAGALLAGVVVESMGFFQLFLLAAGLNLVSALIIHQLVYTDDASPAPDTAPQQA